MNIKNLAMALSASALAITPVVAQAASTAPARSGAELASAEQLEGENGILIAILAAAAIIAGIIIVAGGDDDEDLPTSP